MKKLVLFAVLSFISVTSFSQMDEINGKKYILPDAISSNGCEPFDGADKLNSKINYGFGPFVSSEMSVFVYPMHDVAQLFHANDSLNVIGIAGYISVTSVDTVVHNFLGVADTSFNILEEQVLSNTFGDPNNYSYYELLFDNSVKVIGDFYIRTDFAKPSNYIKNDSMFFDSMNVKYNWMNVAPKIVIPHIHITERCSLRNVIMSDTTWYYILDGFQSTTNSGWKDYYDVDAATKFVYDFDNVQGIYLFPLIGEDEDDTVSSVPSVEVENYTYVFPNPASENVTVQCSFKIKRIEIFNEQGQKISETESNAYNTTIDVSKYPKGTYILKVSTQSGTATKKIVVQ